MKTIIALALAATLAGCGHAQYAQIDDPVLAKLTRERDEAAEYAFCKTGSMVPAAINPVAWYCGAKGAAEAIGWAVEKDQRLQEYVARKYPHRRVATLVVALP